MHLLDVGARRLADLVPARGADRDELLEPLLERPGGRVDDRHGDAVRLLGAPDGLVVQERDDGLPERHALDREEAVPARVELVDDDVRVAVVLERLVVAEPSMMRRSTSSPAHAARTWSVPFRRRDDGACTTTGRRRPDGGAGAIARRSTPGGIISASGTQRIAS